MRFSLAVGLGSNLLAKNVWGFCIQPLLRLEALVVAHAI